MGDIKLLIVCKIMIDGGDHSSKTRSSLSTMDMFQDEPVCWACLNFLVLRLG